MESLSGLASKNIVWDIIILKRTCYLFEIQVYLGSASYLVTLSDGAHFHIVSYRVRDTVGNSSGD